MRFLPMGQEKDGSDAVDTAYSAWTAANGFEKDKATTALLTALAPNIFGAINQFRAASLPPQAVELEGKRLALQAARGWQRGIGNLGSYVSQEVKRGLYQYVTRNQNVATIPREHVARIGPMKRAVEDLTDRFGRDPTALELAAHMNVPLKKVTVLRLMLRPTGLESATEDRGFEDIVDSRNRERVRLAYYGFTDQEKLVFDYSTGAHGQLKLSTNDIAKKLKVSAPRISTIKADIADKIAPYLS